MGYKYRSTTLPQGALLEYVRVGGYMKVMAVDPVSFAEITIVGDPKTPSDILAREAVKKLEFMINKNRPKQRIKQTDPAEAAVKRGRRTDTPSGWEM